MRPWPPSGSGTLFRLPTRPSNALPLLVPSRLCDAYHFSSSSSSRNRVKLAEDSRYTNEPGSSESSSDCTESNASGFSTYSQSQSVSLEGIRNRLKERTNTMSAAATLSLAEIGGRLNKVTGYEHIEALKGKVVETETAISTKRRASQDAKLEYETAVARRSNSQREVNDLLQRKSTWTEADVGRFTVLVREDHLHEQEEARAKARVALAEAEVEAVFNDLMRTILNRYHEEQVWSDKIRSVSTYGSLLALGVNVVVFFLAIVVVEPWKRRRLAQTFEERIEQLSLENREVLGRGVSKLEEHLEKQEQTFAELMGTSLREHHVDTGVTDAEVQGPAPSMSIPKMAKGTRDRDLLVAGAAGVVGGCVLTFLVGFLR